MLFLLSPAKALDYTRPLPKGLPHTLPAFSAEAQGLIDILRECSPADIARLIRLGLPGGRIFILAFPGFAAEVPGG